MRLATFLRRVSLLNGMVLGSQGVLLFQLWTNGHFAWAVPCALSVGCSISISFLQFVFMRSRIR